MQSGRRHGSSWFSSSLLQSRLAHDCHEHTTACRIHRALSTGGAASDYAEPPQSEVRTTQGDSGSSHAADAGDSGPQGAQHEEACEDGEPYQATEEPDEAALEAACERMVLEAVRLLQEGQLEQAEYLISEGAGFWFLLTL